MTTKVRNINIKKDTIFVSIASYRDNECEKTVKSLFDNAKYKNNCFVGICQQNNNKIDDDSLINIKEWNCNINIIRISYLEAKGPTYARYLCSGLWNGEEYYLQIDSHTTFIKNWDEKLINMIKELKNRNISLKPVLSYYPIDIVKINEKTSEIPHIHGARYDHNGILVLQQAIYTNNNNDYMPSYLMAAGMFFCESKFLDEIPFDPTLDYLFEGEEILTSVRFFTNGWDTYTPKENIIYHEFYRYGKPKYYIDNLNNFKPEKARLKVKKILTNNEDIDEKYGLGKVRTLKSFYEKIKINNDIDINININYINIILAILVLIIVIIICLLL
jgi:[Skp1-protein]-hydroxyproline N-acetylglucosaminyltransferase